MMRSAWFRALKACPGTASGRVAHAPELFRRFSTIAAEDTMTGPATRPWP